MVKVSEKWLQGGHNVPRDLYGDYAHKLDSKGRVVLPVSFREDLGQFVMATVGIKKYVCVYPMTEWEALRKRLSEIRTGAGRERDLRTIIIGSARKLEVDSAGRILLPQSLRDYAKITQEVSVNGAEDHVQIWDLAAWKEFWQTTTENLEEIAEGIGWL